MGGEGDGNQGIGAESRVFERSSSEIGIYAFPFGCE